MAKPNACLLRAPGTNCDLETAFAFEACGAVAERVHIERLLETPGRLADYQILCIPGGFSYGDDIGAGVVFADHLRTRLRDVLQDFLAQDRLVLGICNGFQVLLKAGLLAPGEGDRSRATLTWNDSGRFVDRWVRLGTAGSANVFLEGIDEIELPVAHAEGKLMASGEVLRDLKTKGEIALCYLPREGNRPADPTAETLPPPDNPNGAAGNVAALSDATGRVLGLMPHPERFLFATQHPQWTRRGADGDGDGDGKRLFRNAVDYFR